MAKSIDIHVIIFFGASSRIHHYDERLNTSFKAAVQPQILANTHIQFNNKCDSVVILATVNASAST